jgi:hypothetical protein
MRFPKTLLAAALAVSSNAMALDASSLKLQVYAVMLSTSPLCTSPVTVFSSTTPAEVDFLSNPTLGSGNPADATYNCVIIKMSDVIKFTPSTTSGSCTAGTEYVTDVCRTDNGGTTQAPDAVGSPSAGSGTDAAPVTFMQPSTTASNNGLHLTAPPVIAGTASSKFVVNATGKVAGDYSTCGMNPPVFGFQKLP